jgi:hypothetical protein
MAQRSDSGSIQASENVTVLVFKDNYASRTFNIPLHWVSRLGILLGLMIGVTTLSTFAAIKYYRVASKADLNHVQDLEQEIIDLRTNLKANENKSPETGTPLASAPNPAPMTPSAPRLSVTSGSGTATPAGSVFTSFSPSFQFQLPDLATLPFVLQPPKVNWHGKTLRVRFALQYVKKDQGTQEGKILILARGPETLMSYPAGTMAPIGAEYLFAHEKGEPFAVSRFREVKADFGPLKSTSSIHEIEILITSTQGQLLVYKKVPVSKPVSSEHQQAPSTHPTDAETPTESMSTSPEAIAPETLPETSTEGSPSP